MMKGEGFGRMLRLQGVYFFLFVIGVVFGQVAYRLQIDSLVLPEIVSSLPYFVNVHHHKVFVSYYDEHRVVVYDLKGDIVDSFKTEAKSGNIMHPYLVKEIEGKYLVFCPDKVFRFAGDSLEQVLRIFNKRHQRAYLFKFQWDGRAFIFLNDSVLVMPLIDRGAIKYTKRRTFENWGRWRYMSFCKLTDSELKEIREFGQWDILSYSYYKEGILKGLSIKYCVDKFTGNVYVAYSYSPFVHVYDSLGYWRRNLFLGYEWEELDYFFRRENYWLEAGAKTFMGAGILQTHTLALFCDSLYLYKVVKPRVRVFPEIDDERYRIKVQKGCSLLSEGDILLEEVYSRQPVVLMIYQKGSYKELGRIELDSGFNFCGFDEEGRILYFYKEVSGDRGLKVVLFKVKFE